MDSLSACTTEGTPEHEAMLSISKMFKQLQMRFLDEAQKRVMEDDDSVEMVEWLMEMSPFCADCGVENVQYLSTNLGVFLCDDCARCHSQLPRHVSLIEKVGAEFLGRPTSWVKHPSGGDIKMFAWNSSNDLSNGFWEFSLEEGKRPTAKSTYDEKATFVIDKYFFRKYVNVEYGFYGKVQREKEGKKWVERFMKIEVFPPLFLFYLFMF